MLKEIEALGEFIKEKRTSIRSAVKELNECDKVHLNEAAKAEEAAVNRMTQTSPIFRKDRVDTLQDKRIHLTPPVTPRSKKARSDAKGQLIIQPVHPTDQGRKRRQQKRRKEGVAKTLAFLNKGKQQPMPERITPAPNADEDIRGAFVR